MVKIFYFSFVKLGSEPMTANSKFHHSFEEKLRGLTQSIFEKIHGSKTSRSTEPTGQSRHTHAVSELEVSALRKSNQPAKSGQATRLARYITEDFFGFIFNNGFETPKRAA